MVSHPRDCTGCAPILSLQAWCACCPMQAVDSECGEIADETTLRKPHDWRDNPDGRLRTIALFHANYTPVRIVAPMVMRRNAFLCLPSAVRDCKPRSLIERAAPMTAREVYRAVLAPRAPYMS